MHQLTLRQALACSPRPRLALVGAGGKTSLLFALGRAWESALLSTTTHLGCWQATQADRHVIVSSIAAARQLLAHPLPGTTLITGPPAGDRLTAPSPATLSWLHENSPLPLLLEADGARGRALKAPAPHEPDIPPWVQSVVVVSGLSSLGHPLNADHVHRPQRFATLSGLAPGNPITPAALARVLRHPQGGLRGHPPRARRALVLTQAATPRLQSIGQRLAASLRTTYPRIVLTGNTPHPLATYTRIAGIVLAAGASQRFGRPKQTLPHKGIPFVRQVAQTALQAGLDPVVVVLGAHAAAVRQSLHNLPVKQIFNPRWEAGQSTSIQTGLHALPAEQGGAIFLLADQPQIGPTILRALCAEHARTLAPVIAPMVDNQRANPVLFDRVTFPALHALRGDRGGRGIFHRFAPHYLPWLDRSLLLDVDTPQDYERLP